MSVNRTNRIILLERELSRIISEISSNPGHYKTYDPATGISTDVRSKMEVMSGRYEAKIRLEKEIDKINKGIDRESLIDKIIC